MKPRALLAILTLTLITVLGNSCKKNSDGDKGMYDLTNTEWQGEGDMYDRDFKPMSVKFKANHELEVTFIPVDEPGTTFKFTGTWAKDDAQVNVEFKFTKGLETITATATLTENNTKMDDGEFRASGEPDLVAGKFKITRQ